MKKSARRLIRTSCPAGRAAEHDAAAALEELEAAFEGLATDMVEDDVDALALGRLARRADEVALVVEDAVGGAELPGAGELRFAAGGDQDPSRAEQSRDLDAGGGHARTGGVQQDVLVGLQSGACGEHVPGGQEAQRDRRRLDIGEARRNRQDVPPRHGDVLGVAAVAMLAQQAVARAEMIEAGEAARADAAGDP